MKKILIAAIVLTLIPGSANAQAKSPCSDDKSSEFNFWIGEWEVWAGGELAGTNSIQPMLDGCVLQEDWRGARGSAGTSLNFYNPRQKMWRQFWVWRQGTTLELAGKFEDGKMILEGESIGPNGETVANRITWYDNDDGSVRQHWQTSQDGGTTWETAFDGLYARKRDGAVSSVTAPPSPP